MIHTLNVEATDPSENGFDRAKPKRYPTDLTDAEWTTVAPFLPKPAKGRRRTWFAARLRALCSSMY
jgi:hypothetical protein